MKKSILLIGLMFGSMLTADQSAGMRAESQMTQENKEQLAMNFLRKMFSYLRCVVPESVTTEVERQVIQDALKRLCATTFRVEGMGERNSLSGLFCVLKGGCKNPLYIAIAEAAFCAGPYQGFNIALRALWEKAKNLSFVTEGGIDSERAQGLYQMLKNMSANGKLCLSINTQQHPSINAQQQNIDGLCTKATLLFDLLGRPGYLYELDNGKKSFLQKVIADDSKYNSVYGEVLNKSRPLESQFISEHNNANYGLANALKFP
jgi:hypothetical protein